MADATVLLTLGLLFLLGLLADLLGRHTFLPRVTLLLLGGLAIGPCALNLVPAAFVHDWFGLLTSIALGMIGLLLGEKFHPAALRRYGKLVFSLSICKVLSAAALVVTSLLLCGVDLPIALLLGGIAPATAPAATFDVVHETRAQGEFPDTLLRVAAIDDAWGLLLFTMLMAATGVVLSPGEAGVASGLLAGGVEIGGSVLLGCALGAPMAYLTGRIGAGEPTLAEALGLVLLCTGAAQWLQVSPILAAMAMGSTVCSLAR
ncbi:MAG: cation:proton antiporter, partial [Planctomycetes bacterium]|nr:cation:proton antiporter [Planctomycetota bacterium]